MIPVKWLRYIFAAPLIIGIIQGIFEHNRDEALVSLLFAPLFFLFGWGLQKLISSARPAP